MNVKVGGNFFLKEGVALAIVDPPTKLSDPSTLPASTTLWHDYVDVDKRRDAMVHINQCLRTFIRFRLKDVDNARRKQRTYVTISSRCQRCVAKTDQAPSKKLMSFGRCEPAAPSKT